DHIGHWNWNKLIGLGGLLQKRLINAVNEFYKQRGSWVEFTEKQRRYAPRWKRMVDDYENRRSTRNPYISPIDGIKKLEEAGLTADSDEGSDDDDVLPELDTSPGEFLFFGLEIEQQQRELRYDIEAIRAPTNKQLTYMVDRRTKLTRQIRRFRALQLAFMPVALQVISTIPPSQAPLNTEDISLYLPSQLSSSQRPSDLSGIEIRLREGQLNESLNQLRRVILVKQRLLRYKKINARNQGTTTRTCGIIKQQDKKIELAAAAYRAAWDAKLHLLNGDYSSLGWNKLLDEHIVGMEDLQNAERIRAKAAKGNRAEAQRRTLAGEDPVPGAREKNRVASWIWCGTSQGDLETDKALYDGLQTEWCKAYA
ncbi:hypothetical protein K435DRAFT_589493, partial [Dendrothele bispora CBS 962.96]